MPLRRLATIGAAIIAVGAASLYSEKKDDETAKNSFTPATLAAMEIPTSHYCGPGLPRHIPTEATTRKMINCLTRQRVAASLKRAIEETKKSYVPPNSVPSLHILFQIAKPTCGHLDLLITPEED